ncbi:MAG: hypothetical protein PHG83_01380 [Patescibacteria group bacterium]|nr:hypothetical protein [Patescibacteria group bacterium]
MDIFDNNHPGYWQISTNPNSTIKADEVKKTLRKLGILPIEPISDCPKLDKPDKRTFREILEACMK